MRDRYNTTTLGTYRSWRNATRNRCRAGASRPDGNALTGWYGTALVVGILAVFLTSTIAIAFDTHDFLFPQTKCSICEVKKVYKGTSKKAYQEVVCLFTALRGGRDGTLPELLTPATDNARPLSLPYYRESDRAPPTLS